MAFVGGDLEDGVDRGVADRLAGAGRVFAQFGNDGGAGGVLVAQDAGEFGAADEFLDELGRKGRFGLGEVAPIERHWHTGDLPMAGGGVLALACFPANAETAACRGGGEARRWRTCGELDSGADAES